MSQAGRKQQSLQQAIRRILIRRFPHQVGTEIRLNAIRRPLRQEVAVMCIPTAPNLFNPAPLCAKPSLHRLHSNP